MLFASFISTISVRSTAATHGTGEDASTTQTTRKMARGTKKQSSDVQMLRERVTEFCKRAGYRLSPQADDILGDIIHVKEAAGDFYCPCQTVKSAETVCVCQPVRQGLVDVMGACFCGLILAGD